MPPTSRGLPLLRSARRLPPLRPQFPRPRHATTSYKKPLKLPSARTPPPEQPLPKSKPTTPPRTPRPHTLVARLRASTNLKRALLLLPWLPIFGVAYHHIPIVMVPIEGPSMQPTINPSWDSNDDRTHTRTQVLVLKHAFTNTFLSRWLAGLLPSRSKRADPTPQRGQIVVYRTPGNPDRAGVKRVVGVPGDLVTPLPGYPGGDTPVIIPYNHFWLEGDAGDRKKSIDSNYFGPISAQMITGRVLITLPTLHPWFTGQTWEDAPYPAETQHRVEYAVITPGDPDAEATSIAFRDGSISQALKVVKAYPLDRPLTPMERQQWDSLHLIAREEKARRNTETYALANELEAEMRKRLFARSKTETLKNVQMSKEEFQKFKKDGIVPESVLARSDLKGT